MNICFVTGHYAPFAGGIETHVERIAVHFARCGDEVTVMTQTDNPQWPEDVGIDGVHVRRFPVPLPSRNFAVSPALFRALSTSRSAWDIVHAHGYHSATPLLASAAKARPLVFTPHYHGTGHSAFRRVLHVPYRRIGAHTVAASSAVICVSDAERSLFESHFPSASTKTRVIPNGVDIKPLLAATPMPTAKPLIMSAGRLERYKQVDRTVRAFSYLRDRYEFVATGEGPERPRLQEIAKDLGIDREIKLVGRVDSSELYRWFRSARVYVSMSTNEAMGITILEALACGARVVASDIPAHRELRTRYGNLLTLVPVTVSAKELARAIDSAADTGANEPSIVPSWADVADQTRKTYQQVLDSA